MVSNYQQIKGSVSHFFKTTSDVLVVLVLLELILFSIQLTFEFSDLFLLILNLSFGAFITVNPFGLDIKNHPIVEKKAQPIPLQTETLKVDTPSPNFPRSPRKSPISEDIDNSEFKFSQAINDNLDGHFISVGIAERQGRRPTMEDKSCVHINLYKDTTSFVDYLALFDGHGDTPAGAMYLQENLHINLQKMFQEQAATNSEINIESILKRAFIETDQKMAKDAEFYGSTACVVLVVNAKVIYTANTGDTRAILIENIKSRSTRKITRLSTDHRPSDKNETERIKKAGGHIVKGKVNNLLGLTRAFGDGAMKQYGLIADPDISKFELNPDTKKALVIACDGVWDHTSEEETAEVVAENANLAKEASEQVRDLAYSKKSKDNISALVAYL